MVELKLVIVLSLSLSFNFFLLSFLLIMQPFFSDSVSETQIQVRYDVMEVPITLPSLKPPADKPNPKQGIGKTVYDINVTCVYISLL